MPQEQIIPDDLIPAMREGELVKPYARHIEGIVIEFLKTHMQKPRADACDWDSFTLVGRLRWLTEVADWASEHIDSMVEKNLALRRDNDALRAALAAAGVPTPRPEVSNTRAVTPPALRVVVDKPLSPYSPLPPATLTSSPSGRGPTATDRFFRGLEAELVHNRFEPISQGGTNANPAPTVSEIQARIHEIENHFRCEQNRMAERAWLNESASLNAAAYDRLVNLQTREFPQSTRRYLFEPSPVRFAPDDGRVPIRLHTNPASDPRPPEPAHERPQTPNGSIDDPF